MNQDPHQQIKRSWEANARAWTEAVRSGSIVSRSLATNAAILQALSEPEIKRVLDLGCGEGWLTRALSSRGIEVIGVDFSAQLIELARAEGGGTFHHCSYSELIAAPKTVGSNFEAIVCNFSLLEKDILELLKSVRSVLVPPGMLVIQTVHPLSEIRQNQYCDGWRTETFTGFGVGFTEAMPWYFRTLSSWVSLLRGSGYCIDKVHEPVHPNTGEPLSLLLVAYSEHHQG
ncbi:class I SAM-dependent methyltransferase [Gloeothece verrucosa]|uniref:Methyltransferase type 11 n=1 Tax=Gloeothece verrucosa (strain PCC 7822) TaxID=497965 RepID=E0ULI9_GLOV7|nr:class I SAM-dependent methyltransferase [Gloeothece verrucosa]ADN17819.1 Methyltransferase type 11 [Gloeothece verrucosa PCC 7822]